VCGLQRGRKGGGKGKRAPLFYATINLRARPDVHETRENRKEHLSRVQGRVLPISLLLLYPRAKVASWYDLRDEITTRTFGRSSYRFLAVTKRLGKRRAPFSIPDSIRLDVRFLLVCGILENLENEKLARAFLEYSGIMRTLN